MAAAAHQGATSSASETPAPTAPTEIPAEMVAPVATENPTPAPATDSEANAVAELEDPEEEKAEHDPACDPSAEDRSVDVN